MRRAKYRHHPIPLPSPRAYIEEVNAAGGGHPAPAREGTMASHAYPTGSAMRAMADRRACERCGGVLEATEVLSGGGRRELRGGSPVPPSARLPIWRCAACGVVTPRL
jgi:hypothetical protein